MTDHAKKTFLITNALPYANGDLHLGHMVGFLQADMWGRYQKMQGHTVVFVGGDDQHGTPIMLSAEKQGISPAQMIADIEQRHASDLEGFGIDLDEFSGTHGDENRALCASLYEQLKANGHIEVRTIEQAFDESKGMFLPDRYVKGTCPKCKTPEQYGDNCEHCGTTYDPTDLIEPYSILSGEPPVMRQSEHTFFKVSHFKTVLDQWRHSDALQGEVANKLSEWFEGGLIDWDISRDKPYWGFEIPDAPDKYFYVWLDAPVGYMASHQRFAQAKGQDWRSHWQPDSDTEIVHFIGKDIVRFHTLFWPALLHATGHKTPTAVFVHGFLTIDGAKMSKSRGTYITARTYLEHLSPDYLRYYLAAKFSAGVVDLDLNLEDFVQRVNSDLVGKVVNIASRCAGFIHKHFNGILAPTLHDEPLHHQLSSALASIAERYQAREFAAAMREIMLLADQANQFIDTHKPWALAKNPENLPQVHTICTSGLNAFKLIAGALRPVIPALADKADAFLNTQTSQWSSLGEPLLDHPINPFSPLMTRVDPVSVDAMIEDSTQAPEEPTPSQPDGPLAQDPISAEITFDEFAKLDMRVATIVNAQHVEGADKLLQLTLDLGGETRQVFAGIKAAYEPDTLIGRLTVMVANLAPRKMRFGVSEGMVLAAGPGNKDIFLLSPDQGAEAGMRVK